MINTLKPFIISLAILILGYAGIAYAAPYFRQEAGLVPITDSTYYLGTTTPSTIAWLSIITDQLCLTGDVCRTTWPTGGSGTFSWTVQSWGVSTSTRLGFLNGFLSTASSTIDSNLIITGNSTTTNATTTNFFSTTASSTNLFGALINGFGLSTCTGTNALTWTGGSFTCTAQPQGTVTSVTATTPLFSSGGATPNITWAGLATTSQPASSNLLVSDGGAGVFGVATGTISVPTGLTITANRSAVGGAAAIALDTGYVIPLQSTLDAKAEDATTLTIAGTAGQITSSAGAQDISTNRTWTLSLPSFVQISNLTLTDSTTTRATTTNATSTSFFATTASTTNFFGGGLTTCQSGNVLTYDGAGRFGCAADAQGAGTFSWTPDTYGGQIVNATSTGLWLKGSPLGLIASSTFATNATTTNATTTNLSISGNLDVDNLTSALVLTGTGGDFAEYTGTTCTNQFVRVLSALGVATCATVGAADVSLAELTAGTGLSSAGTYTGATARTFSIDQSFTPTWTGAHIFNNITRSTTTQATTTTAFFTTASTTNFFGAGLQTCQSNNVLTYDGAGKFGCEADDSGGGGASDTFWATSTGAFTNSIFPNSGSTNTGIGIGTTTPAWTLQIASSTRPQLTLSDSGVLTNNHWSFRNAGGLFYLATSSPTTFATSTVSVFSFNANGIPTFSSLGTGFVKSTNGLFSTSATVDISADTNLTGDTENVLTGDALSIGSTITRDTEWNGIDFFVGTTQSALSAEVVAGTGVGTWFSTPSSANLATAVTGETGTGALVFGTTPTFTTSALFPLGSVSAPGISFTGDTNNGIWSAGADILNFATNGIERARFTLGCGWLIATTTDGCIANQTIASSTASQLMLSSGAGFAQWGLRNAGGNLYFATTTVAGTATSTPAALELRNSGTGLGIATSTFSSSILGLGTTGSTNGTSTIATGKWQIDGYDSAGTRYCTFLVAGTLTSVAGACNQ